MGGGLGGVTAWCSIYPLDVVKSRLQQDNRTYAGFWDCEPGRWRIEMGATEHEYFHVIHGRARLFDEAGAVQEFGPGQAVVIPAGFKGSFEVLEPLRKHFVIVER